MGQIVELPKCCYPGCGRLRTQTVAVINDSDDCCTQHYLHVCMYHADILTKGGAEYVLIDKTAA